MKSITIHFRPGSHVGTRSGTQRGIQLGYGNIFTASGQNDVHVGAVESTHGQNEGDVLTATGIVADIVNAVIWTFTIQSTSAGYLDGIEKIGRALNSTGVDASNRERIMASVLVAATDYRTRLFPTEGAIHNYLAWVAYLRTNETPPPPLAQLSDIEDDDQARKAAEYYLAFANGSVHRSVVITSSGRLAIGPDIIAVNDVVTILWGCRLPIVLRPISGESTHEVVGPCYVDGIMEGEAVEKHENDGKEDQVFDLR
jgi:hypothetical protein